MRIAWIVVMLVTVACGGGSGGAALDEPCGGPDDIRCATGYCAILNDTCDGSQIGVCRDGGLCDSSSSPTCGCDGQIYEGYCLAAAVGADELGRCTPPDGEFSCGSGFCDAVTEYCAVLLTGQGGDGPHRWCKPLPAGCNGTASCDCLGDIVCTDGQEIGTCTEESPGFRVTCP